jgi:BirA family biotin operon repressor/biotin-[acetyl-CoA-carboxylase] ligase
MVMNLSYDHLSLDRLRRHLTTELVGQHIYLFGAVESTNTVLRRLAERGAREGTVVFAETETEDSGGGGAPWLSPEGVKLYASVLFRPRLADSEVRPFACIGALALNEAIEAEGAAVAITRPNDVVVDGRRVGGVLLDCAAVGGFTSHVILGIGVTLTGQYLELNAFTARLLNLLEKWHGIFLEQGRDAVLAAWEARDAVRASRAPLAGSRR